jgi:hypothetical protein
MEEPRPGITPTAVPRNAPTKTQSRFMGVKACEKPSRSRGRESISRKFLPGCRRAN